MQILCLCKQDLNLAFWYRKSYALLWRVISIKIIILLPNAECACELQLSRLRVLSHYIQNSFNAQIYALLERNFSLKIMQVIFITSLMFYRNYYCV